MSSKTVPSAAEYRVLARKYRPQNFDELIGQDALVRTLKNAIETGRVAHAFMLTGVRGVGKTTTARIIAKALNYKGPDGKSGPTTGSTDDCPLCQAISEDRHPDVIEMDAASRTGVDDVREILDGVRYAPTEARFKIYIIDEVHMLSKNAFNALLKTLEEPPPHVKFIFATTEIRKVPVTVLSRCQRFDLRRVDVEILSNHFKKICGLENVKAEDEAIALIARAADGSVRDGLSLLDQAIASGGDNITTVQVQNMIGLADRARNMDLLEHALQGNTAEALAIMDDLYKSGSDPLTLMQDLLDLTHTLTRLHAAPNAQISNQTMAADQMSRAKRIASEISMPSLGKTWQILLKGVNEVQNAPSPQSAAEMIIIRLAYAADLPDPSDLIKKLSDSGEVSVSTAKNSAPARSSSSVMAAAPPPYRASSNLAVSPQEDNFPQTTAEIKNLQDVIGLLEANREFLLASQVFQFLHLVKLQEGHIEFRPNEQAPPRFAQDLGQRLSALAGRRWMVSVSSSPGAPTLAQQGEQARAQEFQNIIQMPMVQDFLKVFPQAKLTDIIEPAKPKE